MIRNAHISACERYRYNLSRDWDQDLPAVYWIMLNPSTADAVKDDPTIRRCINYSKDWGYGAAVILNLFAYRATQVKDLYAAHKSGTDIIGPENDRHLSTISKIVNPKKRILQDGEVRIQQKKDIAVAAWGNHGSYLSRHEEILDLFEEIRYLRLTQSNQPSHPLYLPKNLAPVLWDK